MSGERLLQMKVARGQNKSQGQTTYSRFSHKTEAHSHPFHTQYRRAKIEGFDFDQTVHIKSKSLISGENFDMAEPGHQIDCGPRHANSMTAVGASRGPPTGLT